MFRVKRTVPPCCYFRKQAKTVQVYAFQPLPAEMLLQSCGGIRKIVGVIADLEIRQPPFYLLLSVLGGSRTIRQRPDELK